MSNIFSFSVAFCFLWYNSKKATHENKDIFFENTNFSLKELYNALTYLEPFKDNLQQYFYEHIQKQYKPNNECVFY